jgi:hypothetical protein
MAKRQARFLISLASRLITKKCAWDGLLTRDRISSRADIAAADEIWNGAS